MTARVSHRGGHRAALVALARRRHGRPVSLEHFGASADAKTLFREFGITADAAVAAAKDSLGRGAG